MRLNVEIQDCGVLKAALPRALLALGQISPQKPFKGFLCGIGRDHKVCDRGGGHSETECRPWLPNKGHRLTLEHFLDSSTKGV